MTLVALVAIIALAAGGLIVVMLAIAHVERIDDARPPFPRQTPEAATARAQKPPRRPAWHGITQAWTSWRHRHADDKGKAAWLAAAVACSVVLSYLIAHIG